MAGFVKTAFSTVSQYITTFQPSNFCSLSPLLNKKTGQLNMVMAHALTLSNDAPRLISPGEFNLSLIQILPIRNV